jgi:serine/threonine-protein kinase
MADAITGTPLYLAPESVTAPDSVDARTDLYSLGAVGYWLLTGTHVFAGKSVLEVCAQHLHSVPDAPSARLGAPVASDLAELILACLAKRPEDRPASANALRDRLRACAAASLWTNARAAQWWADHRHQLHSGGAGTKTPSVDSRGSHLTVTRLAG